MVDALKLTSRAPLSPRGGSAPLEAEAADVCKDLSPDFQDVYICKKDAESPDAPSVERDDVRAQALKDAAVSASVHDRTEVAELLFKRAADYAASHDVARDIATSASVHDSRHAADYGYRAAADRCRYAEEAMDVGRSAEVHDESSASNYAYEKAASLPPMPADMKPRWWEIWK